MRRDRYSELANKLLPHLPQLAPVVRISGGGEGGGTPGVITFDDIDGQLGEGQALWVDSHIEDAIAQFIPHDILDAVYHSVTGAQYSIIGLTDTDTLGLLQSTADGATNHNTILRSGADGDLALDILTLGTLTASADLLIDPVGGAIIGLGVELYTEDYTADGVAGWRLAEGNFDGVAVTANEIVARQSLYAAETGFRVIHHTHDYDHAHVVVNPGPFWNLDEQFGVDIDDNLLVRGYIVGKHAIQLPGAMMICHYDGAEPYETNFTGNAAGHMGQVGDGGGGIIYRAGKFGKAVQIAEATINRVTNPSFETGDAGWSPLTGGTATGIRSQSDNRARYGNYSYRVLKTGGGNGDDYGASTVVAVTPGNDVSASAWVYVASMTGTDPIVRLQLTDGTTTANADLSAVAGEWVRLRATIGEVVGNVTVYLYFSSGQGEFYFDAVQVEELNHVSPYADGSLGTGHAWAGTPHQSVSTRSDASLSYAADTVFNPAAITVGCWVRRSSDRSGYIVAHPSIAIELL